MATARTWLIHLGARECADLLASTSLGRLGVVIDGRPEIFPVCHVYDRRSGCVVFPTNDRTKLHAALSWPWVAYEVDGLDPGGDGGWSVLVVGRTEQLTDDAGVAALARQRRVPWRAGNDSQWVKIVPTKVTGRRISAST